MAGKITKVEAMDDQSDCISIELENGSMIILELAPKRGDPLFAEIRDLSRPRTDGDRIYWSNGASLTLDDVLEMVEDGRDA